MKLIKKEGGIPKMKGLLKIHNKVINLRPIVNSTEVVLED